MACIRNCTKCLSNATGPPYCCSGFCLQYPGEESGLCNYQMPLTIACPMEPEPANDTKSSTWIVYVVIGSLVGLICLFAIIALIYWKQRKLERFLTKREAAFFFYGDPESTTLTGYAHENTDNLPYNKELEISESDFTIDWEKPLGQGCYGSVLKGLVRDKIPVAAKTTRAGDVAGNGLRALMSEIKVLQYIGTAENVVCMVGSHTAKLQQGKIFLFLEFCPLGSLEKFLRDNSGSFKNTEVVINDYENLVGYVPPEVVYTTHDMRLWCKQIATAMDYLEKKKVIHADLATRNVLLFSKDCAKITDFGLSRRLYDYSNYVKQHQEPLPWRWMALESLRQLTFSHKSDVWSLGITMWEIYSLGDIPYAGLTWNSEFVSSLQGNLRPIKPPAASNELYDLMLDCWNPVPDERPSFKQIYERLGK